LFIKPATALLTLEGAWAIPAEQGEVHHETEVALLIGSPLQRVTAEQARQAVVGYGLGLDLTLRDLQTCLKQQGHPWERAKAFDGACPLSAFVPAQDIAEPEALTFSLQVNGVVRQQGDVRDMLLSMFELVAHMSHWFTLLPGDVVLTGTPAGVAALQPGDQLALILQQRYRFDAAVAPAQLYE
jgi:2-keto-4-pentenoate hydratase/2-oxohepta-3-ene-1,7-dioic acid hydratase in catechol pathway